MALILFVNTALAFDIDISFLRGFEKGACRIDNNHVVVGDNSIFIDYQNKMICFIYGQECFYRKGQEGFLETIQKVIEFKKNEEEEKFSLPFWYMHKTKDGLEFFYENEGVLKLTDKYISYGESIIHFDSDRQKKLKLILEALYRK